jgi:hypothetical protein
MRPAITTANFGDLSHSRAIVRNVSELNPDTIASTMAMSTLSLNPST